MIIALLFHYYNVHKHQLTLAKLDHLIDCGERHHMIPNSLVFQILNFNYRLKLCLSLLSLQNQNMNNEHTC